jgi:hypothetical protein
VERYLRTAGVDRPLDGKRKKGRRDTNFVKEMRFGMRVASFALGAKVEIVTICTVPSDPADGAIVASTACYGPVNHTVPQLFLHDIVQSSLQRCLGLTLRLGQLDRTRRGANGLCNVRAIIFPKHAKPYPLYRDVPFGGQASARLTPFALVSMAYLRNGFR